MSAATKLAQIQVKIQRGREHFTELNNKIGAFYATQPYQVMTRREPNRGLIYYLTKVEPVPTHIATIAGDVIQNLRSALDHLAWQLYLIGTSGRVNDEKVYFPIADDATKYGNRLRKLTYMRADAITAFNSIQPYKGGKDEKLWILNKLNNIDKHRLLVTVGSVFRSINIGKYMTTISAPQVQKVLGKPMPKINLFFKTADNLYPLEKGKELFIDKVHAQVIPDLFRCDVVINEAGLIEGASLIETINDFITVVEAVVKQFEPCLI
ncbi:MAG: hypothetical protein ABSB71_04970 [Candidatus Bathyarchaeia archaeon]|jgi:hypothetical protein